MAGTLSVPNIFAGQSGNVPVSELDTDLSTIATYVNVREVDIGLVGARPAAGTAGRWFLATDVNGGTLYVDSGVAWVQAASGVTAAGGVLAVSGGGTGQVTLVSGSYLKGNGTSAITQQSTPLPVADLGSGAPSASNFLRGDGTWATPTVGSFTPSFTSTATAFTFSSVTTLAHGLASLPPLVRVVLRNATAEGGYSIGDEIDVQGTVHETNSSASGISFAVDATNITVMAGTAYSIADKGTAGNFGITAANWTIVARAWL